MALTLPDLVALYAGAGRRLYGGEAVSQRAHALQAAHFARAAGLPDALVAACLLHDLGHLLSEQSDDALANGDDDLHQYRALPFLRGLFGEAVVEPIGLHVAAKRYLCRAEPGYRAALSPASQASLALQGGPMSEDEAAAFLARPHAAAAIALRRCDDAAKVAGLVVADLDAYLPLLERLAATTAGNADTPGAGDADRPM
ncbi:phosphonate degradation HD-domain oxygenase [Chitinimonas koreensis]|uniref:phosphonate degradation HD-domain oxygenase n=1 Tax=Chitinimonas koreensis TaxID=356302 RepID=UPI00040828E3|nr:phosphonate degradation HD-domain oxygenase [Chitinimonas koreensis]QNM98605.1 phosphohydrolase [Chitinimonas koreensis]